MNDRVLAKAVSPDTRSDGIVVSFGSQCYESLRDKRFTSVIRKRVPRDSKPRWLYFHINAPKSSICARAEILSVEGVGRVGRSKVLAMAQDLDLSEEQIRAYLGREGSVGCYKLGAIQFPAREVSAKEITKHMVYHPPQSFFLLSRDGKRLLDQLCGFPRSANAELKSHRK